ncbi:MAG: pantoate--beta-alanine ligase [Bacteroidales bacterium]|nr:pantoate--beta-alanine ligase [Tenuifilaceae bacterium]
MKTVTTVAELQSYLNIVRSKGQSIGFVPTMGALHKGHTELMRIAKTQNPVVVVSIFVNPTQFNNSNDLRNYPRTLEQDLAKCEAVGVSIVFAPSVNEMYPTPDTRQFDFGNLDKVMEGQFRPGHFNGVAQVVNNLFEMVKPNSAYFGQKDFQQLAIIRKLVSMLNLGIQIVSCPTVREDDGLAMSSRNALLTPEQRHIVPLISQTLFAAQNKKVNFNVKELTQWVKDQVNSSPLLEVEYFEIANVNTLEPLEKWNETEQSVGCIAVQVGDVRLIDNILF